MEKAVGVGLDRRVEEIQDSWDLPILCVGKEGVAKSHLMRQWAAYMSKKQGLPFTVKDNIHFTTEALIKACEVSPPGTVHILDEARRDLLKSKSTSHSNVNFNNFLSECRNLGLIIIIILPQFSDIDRYIAHARLKILVRVKTVKNPKTLKKDRGFYDIIKTTNKKVLMKVYEQKYTEFPRNLIWIRGRFNKVDPIDTKVYEDKKKRNREDKYQEDKKATTLNANDKDKILVALDTHKQSVKAGCPEYYRYDRLIKKLA